MDTELRNAFDALMATGDTTRFREALQAEPPEDEDWRDLARHLIGCPEESVQAGHVAAVRLACCSLTDEDYAPTIGTSAQLVGLLRAIKMGMHLY